MFKTERSETISEANTEPYISRLFPDVLRSDLKTYRFDPQHIKQRLLIETCISEKDAEKVMIEVTRAVIRMSKNVKIITGPMLRELTNSVLLQFGLEKERLQNTRVGLPMYELKLMKEQGRVNGEVSEHVWKEFNGVNSIIKRLRNE